MDKDLSKMPLVIPEQGSRQSEPLYYHCTICHGEHRTGVPVAHSNSGGAFKCDKCL